jgi:FdhD protein
MEASVSEAVVTVPVARIEGSSACEVDDVLAVEEPLEFRLDQITISLTMRTPGDDFELAAGFLFAEDLIAGGEDILSISRPADGNPNVVEVRRTQEARVNHSPAKRNFLMTSACGVCGKASIEDLERNTCPALSPDHLRVDSSLIRRLPDRLRVAQAVFQSTGGLHAAALFDFNGELQAVREDVGRHNAVDKLIGAALLNRQTPLSRKILLVSGRASFELAQKALMASIPLLAAVGAPSSLAVATARKAGMTLIGFLRNDRFNVYSGAGRITVSENHT